MPVRSLGSPVLRWPDRETVHKSVVGWVTNLLQARHDVVRVGYFGSYARGDWGFGSDLDLIVILDASGAPSERRQLGLDVLSLPVSVDLLVYTADEWRALAERDTRFYREVMAEAVWVYPYAGDSPQA